MAETISLDHPARNLPLNATSGVNHAAERSPAKPAPAVAPPRARLRWNWDYFSVGAVLSLAGVLILLEIVRIAAGR